MARTHADARKEANNWRRTAAGMPPYAPALLIAAAVFAANLNALSAGFVWDDGSIIVNNTLIRHLSATPQIFTHTFLAGYYRPVVSLSFAVEYAIWGLRPFGFHLTNILLHVANSLLVFGIIRRILHNADCSDTAGRASKKKSPRSSGAAFLAALLWAAHPAHKGIVVIADRTGMLSAFFFLSSLALFVGYRETNDRKKARFEYASSIALCALAFFSKEEALPLPFIIIMIDVLFYRDNHNSACEGMVRHAPAKRFRSLAEVLRQMRSAALYIPFFVLDAIYLLARASVLGPAGGITDSFLVEPVRRFLTIPKILLNYILLLGFPLKLDMNPRTALASFPPTVSTCLAAGIIAALVASIPWLLKKSRAAAFGTLWFLIMFAPMSNIIPIFPDVAGRELFTPIHFLYLPSVGFFLCAGIGMTAISERFRPYHFSRRMMALGYACLVLVFCLLSVRRNTIWKNDVSLFENMAGMHPENSRIRVNLGNAYLNAGMLPEALKEFQQAADIEPASPEIHNALGLAYLNMGSTDRAIEEFRKSAELDPHDSGAYSNLAVAYMQNGMIPEAVTAGKRAVELAPSSSQAHTNIGLIYMQTGMLDEALSEFQIALECDREDADAHNALGALHMLRKDYVKARLHFEEALRIRPGYKEAWENLEDLRRTGR